MACRACQYMTSIEVDETWPNTMRSCKRELLLFTVWLLEKTDDWLNWYQALFCLMQARFLARHSSSKTMFCSRWVVEYYHSTRLLECMQFHVAYENCKKFCFQFSSWNKLSLKYVDSWMCVCVCVCVMLLGVILSVVRKTHFSLSSRLWWLMMAWWI